MLFDINLAFNLRVVKMSEIPQRPLRATRTPKFHNSDVFNIHMKDDEIDNYAALANPYRKEIKPQPASSNTLAKILVKFINETNLKFQKLKKESNKQKSEKLGKLTNDLSKPLLKNQYQNEAIRKMSLVSKKEQDAKAASKAKELYSFKGTGGAQGQSNKPKNNSLQNRKPNPSLETGILSNLQNHSITSHQLSQLQESYPGVKQYMNVYASNPQDFENIVNLARQQQLMMSQNSFVVNQKFQYGNTIGFGKSQIDQKGGFKNVPKGINENKLFKRSSYHVAIAYHIHLKKLHLEKADAAKIANLDPTYHAKKLREDKTKQLEQEEQKNQRQN